MAGISVSMVVLELGTICPMRKTLAVMFCRNKSGGERGIRTPGTASGTTDFESAAFDHSAISPRSRSTAGSRGILSGRRDFLLPVQVRTQCHWDRDRPVGVLVVLEERDERTTHGEP